VPPESPRETHLEDAEDPLRPDPGNEHEFEVEDNRFAFSPGQLGKLINPKSLHALHALGGIEGLEKGLRTDLKAGLSLDETTLDGQVTFEQATGSGDRRIGNSFKPTAPARAETSATQTTAGKPHNNSFKDRLRVFKDNRLPEKESKSLLHLMWIEFMDKALLLLSVAAVISLALGLYQTFGAVQRAESGPKIDWVKGVAIIVAIVIVVVGAGNDYQKELQFVKLNKKVIF
jgi:Ca2+-transporting ATPase